MNSMFSSFDALFAESFGWKVSYSQPKTSMKVVGKEIGSENTAPAPVAKKASGEKGKQRMKNPRFAVELDGIHCFETILPY